MIFDILTFFSVMHTNGMNEKLGPWFVTEIIGGWWFVSVALIAAYTCLRMQVRSSSRRWPTLIPDATWMTFGTGKLGDLAAFTSAIALAMIALLIGYESVDRLASPVPIAFN
jgi:Co/Zn/Cd efflux system component